MERSHHVMFLQELDQARTLLQVTAYDIEHVCVVGGVAWYLRQSEEAMTSQRLQTYEILLPEFLALRLNIIEVFQLCPEEGGIDFGWQERRAHIHPTILVDCTTEELGTVCTFFPNNLGTADESLVIDGEQSALTTCGDIFGLMKREGSQMTYPPPSGFPL